MADINVERRGPGILPWILGVLALALLAWLLISLFDEEPEVDGALMTDTVAAVHTDPSTVPGELDAGTRFLLQGQPAFLVVDEANVQLTGGAGGA